MVTRRIDCVFLTDTAELDLYTFIFNSFNFLVLLKLSNERDYR